MSLRSDIAQLQNDVSSQFPLDVEIVLSRILSPHFRLKIPVEQHGTERGPILRSTARRTQYAVKGIGTHSSGLRDERSIQEGCGQERAAAEWRFGAELFEHQLLHGIVEQAPAAA